MARFKREQLEEQVERLLERGIVYKVEVDDLKHSVSSTYSDDKGKLLDKMARNPNATAYQNPHSESDSKLYYEMPYNLAHMYGAKFNKLLPTIPDSTYKRAVLAFQQEWKSIHEGMEVLKIRQTMGRRPAENPKKVVGTRIQQRGICSCCFRQQAVVGTRIADHGFRLKYEQRNGSCSGSGKAHFGTEEGLKYTTALAAQHRNTAKNMYARADAILSGDAVILDKKTFKPIENPTQRQINIEVANLRNEAEFIDRTAKQYEVKVNEWIPEDTVSVEVDQYE